MPQAPRADKGHFTENTLGHGITIVTLRGSKWLALKSPEVVGTHVEVHWGREHAQSCGPLVPFSPATGREPRSRGERGTVQKTSGRRGRARGALQLDTVTESFAQSPGAREKYILCNGYLLKAERIVFICGDTICTFPWILTRLSAPLRGTPGSQTGVLDRKGQGVAGREQVAPGLALRAAQVTIGEVEAKAAR